MKQYNQTLQTNNSSLEEIITQINNLPNAGSSEPNLQDKTVTPTTSKQTITADSGYDGLDTVTVNAMPTATQATPSISVNSSTGLITATATQTAGYVTAGTKSTTSQLTTQVAKTITPSTSNQTAVAKNVYTTGVVTVKGDTNLVAANIVSGKSIFGVTGTATTGEDLDTELTTQEGLIQQLSTILDSKASGGSGGEIGTCTITIDHMDTPGYQIIATQIVDGVETIYFMGVDYYESYAAAHPINLSNIKCGSAIVFEVYNDYLLPDDRIVELSSGVSLVKMYQSSGVQPGDYRYTTTWVFKAPSEAGVDCTITIM